MPYEVIEKDVPEVLVASVTRVAPLATIGKEIGEAFHELMETVEPVGYGPGMPGTICLEPVDEVLDGRWEIFMPVARSFEPPEGMEVKPLPAAHVASAVHVGRYDRLGEAYEALELWAREHQREIVGPPRELYLNDPYEAGEDRAETELQFPIACRLSRRSRRASAP